MEQVLNRFCLDGSPVSCERYGEGHINLTFLVVTDSGRRYILQRLSRAAFSDIPSLMRNVTAVTEFLSARNSDPRSSLHLVPTKDGQTWCRDEAGEYWRVYDFVEDSLCLQTPESPMDFYQSAVAFGRFQNQLRDFPAETLCETIPNFHNTPWRMEQLEEAARKDAAGRLSEVRAEPSAEAFRRDHQRMQNTDLIRRYVMLPGGALIDIHLDLIDQGGAVDLVVLLHHKEVAPLQGGFRRGPDGVYARKPAGCDDAAPFGFMGVVIEPDDAGKVKDHCSSDIHAGHSHHA